MTRTTTRRIPALSIVAVMLLRGASLAAQEAAPVSADLVTDRPGYTETSVTVPMGSMQVESGVTLDVSGTREDRDRSITTPQLLLRVGIANRAELRVSSDGLVEDWHRLGTRYAHAAGRADMQVGAKLVLLPPRGHGFTLATIPMVSLPIGSAALSSHHVDPTIKLTWAAELAHGFDLSGNGNVSAPSDDLGRHAQQAVSASLGHALPGGWSAYVDAYGIVAHGAGAGQPTWAADGGVTERVRRHAQFDIEVGHSLSGPSPDWFVAGGFCLRADGRRGHS